jgi:aryl-alcohol dehydrogenase-like predicted oxidoreductase
VVGARTADQARENAAAADLELDDELCNRLSRITDPIKQTMGRNVDPWEHVSRLERSCG